MILPKLITFGIAFRPFTPWTRFTDFGFATWFSFNFWWCWITVNVGETRIRLDSFSVTRVAWTIAWPPFFPFTRATAFWSVACFTFFKFIRTVTVFWGRCWKSWWTDAFPEWLFYHGFTLKYYQTCFGTFVQFGHIRHHMEWNQTIRQRSISNRRHLHTPLLRTCLRHSLDNQEHHKGIHGHVIGFRCHRQHHKVPTHSMAPYKNNSNKSAKVKKQNKKIVI